MEELIGEKETEDKAKNFASLIKGFKNSLLINLIGNLGTGKTTFVRGLIQELGFDEFVKSPTFTIVESYESDNLKVFHFDLYRIEDDKELQAIGVEDYLTEENAITLVEWPEKSKRYFNNPDYIIELNHCDNDEKRLINIIKDLRQ